MAYKDGETFTTYCDKPYDRHHYKLKMKNGKSVIFEDYETMRAHWYHWRPNVDRVLIIDAKKGF